MPLFPTINDTSGNPSRRLTAHHAVYFILLTVLCGSQAVSNWMMSGCQILIAVNWALECDWLRKYQRARKQPLLAAWLVFALVYILWFIPGPNYHFGLFDLFCKLPLLAIPLLVLTSHPLSRWQRDFALFAYVATVFVATVIGFVRYLTIPDLPYRDIIPFISHIRFALNISLAVVVTVWQTLSGHKIRPVTFVSTALSVALAAWFVFFLFLLRSYTGLAALAVTALLLLVCFSKRLSSRPLRVALVTLTAALLVAATVTLALMVRDYYRPTQLATQPLAAATPSGNPYQHKQNGLIENGNLVYNYVCPVELEAGWPRLSRMPLYDTTPNGYTVYPTLIRYLNALGTTKDSVGLTLLTPDDVQAIEKGIANPVYLQKGSIRKMVYVMLYEYESSRVLGSVVGFTMLQRLHLWDAAWSVFVQHPLFGVGTCNVRDAVDTRLAEQHSPLAPRQLNIHNQYLTTLVTFGIVGVAIIIFFFVRAFRRGSLLRHPIAVASLTITLMSFLTENTLSTLAGCVFTVLIFTIFAANQP